MHFLNPSFAPKHSVLFFIYFCRSNMSTIVDKFRPIRLIIQKEIPNQIK